MNKFENVCVSFSKIRSWYREGSQIPLTAPISRGGSKDRQTTSTLSITPQREDDGAKYRCVVWNRAMAEGQRLETTVTLNVNCKYNSHSSRLYPKKKEKNICIYKSMS